MKDQQAAASTAAASWVPGAYSAADALNASSFQQLRSLILKHVAGEHHANDTFAQRVKFVRGFFNLSLTPGLPHKCGMRAAAYIDLDVDHYLPTAQALDWIFTHKLAVPGTLIGYDDIGYTQLWTQGESRAHMEAAKKFGVAFELVASECKIPHKKGGTEADEWKPSSAQRAAMGGLTCVPIPADGCSRNFHPVFRVVSVDGAPKLC